MANRSSASPSGVRVGYEASLEESSPGPVLFDVQVNRGMRGNYGMEISVRNAVNPKQAAALIQELHDRVMAALPQIQATGD